MAVTIQKIAELSGVSRGTVDRVLHGRPNVNPMIREKVVRAAEKLGYQPPVPPKSADCRQAAILIPQWTDGHFNRQIVSGIRKALRYIADPAFVLTEQPLRTMTMQELLRAMDEQIRSGVDGLIIRAENTPEVPRRHRAGSAARRDRHYLRCRRAGQRPSVLCRAGFSPRRRNRCRRYGAAHSSARTCTHRLRQPAYGITQGPCGRFLPPAARAWVLRGRLSGYRDQRNARSYERTGRAGRFVSDSRLHAVYMANQPLSGCISGIRKARRAVRPHIICNDLTPAAKRYLRDGTVDFVVGQTFSQESFQAVLAMYQMLLHGVKPKRELYYTDLRLITQEML